MSDIKIEKFVGTQQFEQWSLQKIFDKSKEGELEIQEFQRKEIWDNAKQSRLIESILRDIPIPAIYLEKESDKKYVVIDGQQRIKSITHFLKGGSDGLKLVGLSKLTELKNLKYEHLKGSEDSRRKLKDAKIPVIIISDCSKEMKYEIFERLNTGAMQLNPQELRNCMFHGNYNDMIKKLSRNEDFKYLLGSIWGKYHNRMIDAELILRFFAFSRLKYYLFEKYKSPMKKFLNNEMENHRIINDVEAKELTEKIFEKSVRLTKLIFGRNAFRKFSINSEEEISKWDKNINKSLFDITMCGFSILPYDEKIFSQYASAIKEELLYLMTENKEFMKSTFGGAGITSTNNSPMVKTRFNIWLESVKKLVENKKNIFPSDLKNQIYEKSPNCCICGKRIQNIDDAVINGVKYYWRGEIIPINSELAHRYCDINTQSQNS